MGHYAKVENGIVTQVIVADGVDWCEQNLGGEWIQTSYNRKFRGSFAGIGSFYLPEEDIFTNLQGKSNWLKLAHDREPNILNQKSILLQNLKIFL